MQKEQLVAKENARQKELEEVAKKRQVELKAKLAKAGVVPLEMERKVEVVPVRWTESLSFRSNSILMQWQNQKV